MADGSQIPKITISDRAVGRLRAGHVWVYASDVLNVAAAGPGDLVYVVSQRGKLLGSALYSSASQIKLRMISREPLVGEEQFRELVRKRLKSALDYRTTVVSGSDAYRLVFSEGDLLPGLVVDRYNNVFVIQVLTQAWDRAHRKQLVIEWLRESARAEHVLERVDARIQELEQLPQHDPEMLFGSKSATVVKMNGIQLHYDGLAGQKTGAFLDQRENYAAAESYARGEALDVCTYQGGFALHLARRCEHVTALDISREVLEVAEQNEKLNAGSLKNEMEWIEANAFDLMRDYADAARQYDTIVLDPPAFARSKRNLAAAMRGYKELNLRAMKMLRPDGVLVTCSCSFAVSEDDFLGVLTEAAQDAHKSVQIIEKRTQSRDHPILLGVPETYYLKCAILRVS
jgi:23S rRNA (cytosine1962-C5)-methyltransferase